MDTMTNTATVGAQTGTDNVTVTANEPGQNTGTQDVSNQAQQTSGNEQTQQEERTYSVAELTAEVDRRVQQAQQKWQAELESRLKSERDEGARLAKLSAEERAKEEQKKAQEKFEEERQQYQRDKLEFETTKQLAERNLPVTFAKLLAGSDADSTKENIENFQKEWASALQREIDNKIKGSAPKAGTETEIDAFLSGFTSK